jgi:DNA-binding NtrC family response regulator
VAQHLPEHSAVLVVDDEPILRMFLADELRECGFLPLEALDAEEAVEILRTKVDIDVVITDVKMPGPMDGFGLAKWIRKNRPGLPVFIVSGYSGMKDVARELCESERFVEKPYDVRTLITSVTAVVQQRRTNTVIR